jgi:allantoate deiminase/N-carbamoyl-L-amino-acid hydrolase
MVPIQVDGQRLLDHLVELAQIGADPTGGMTRLAYSPTDQQARAWFVSKAEEIGLAVSIDPVGNMLALEPGAGNGLPVLSGSHLDTVRRGGRFDGMLGVAAALEAVRAIRHRPDLPRGRPLGVLVLAAEESTRFGSVCLGSRTIVNDLPADALQTLADANGVTLFEALQQAGLAPERLSEARRKPGWFYEFVEIHVDQADDLVRAGVPVGIITGIAAPTRLWITVEGQQAHSGAALMSERRDALTGAAEIVLTVESTARTLAEREIVGTVGVLRVQPGSMNTVPGLVELGVDIRGIKATTVDQVVEQVKQAADQVAEKRRLTVKVSVVSRARPVQVSQRQIDRLIEACQTAGVEQIRLASRSAHDAMYLGQHGPISMLFVRNPAGISHNPAEEARDEDIIAAGSVLATYLAWLAGQN